MVDVDSISLAYLAFHIPAALPPPPPSILIVIVFHNTLFGALKSPFCVKTGVVDGVGTVAVVVIFPLVPLDTHPLVTDGEIDRTVVIVVPFNVVDVDAPLLAGTATEPVFTL